MQTLDIPPAAARRSAPVALLPIGAFFCAFLLAVAVLTSAGCSLEQLGQAQAQATLIRGDVTALKAQVEDLKARAAVAREAAATQPAGPAKNVLLATATRAEELATQAAPVLAKAEQAAVAIEASVKAADPTDKLATVQAVIDSAAPLIPGYGTMISFIGGAIIGLIRAGYNRAAARSIARSIELAQKPDGTLNLDDEATQDDLRARQGAGGARIVNEAQGKATALPF